ncbi:NAD(P)-binding domain-containing protein [Patulibacter sp. SYSU D01012]|uniref:NADPH-dependent F420 reductase n=1 Tax=Patulibacter sp. SYSU D01012 TaxID=2817381 RepID=UPI001B303FDE|nr:NAD(P)-binding domain-containing protein [Patulibacter sp. SYSU D01012]
MKIGIIGAGHIGSALTHRLTELGHDVRVANSRGPETLRELADETGATAVPATEAADGAEIVVVTIPAKNVPDLPDGILDGAAPGAVVVDTNNYYPQQRDGRIDAIEGGMPESAWTAQQLGRPVIKAFNNIYAAHIRTHGRPAGDPERIALPVAGDDGAAKAKVLQLVDDLGFDPVDAGGLDESWRQQPGTPVYGTDLGADALREALAAASPDRPADFSA